MAKKGILAIILVVALFLSGCTLVEKDVAVDMATEVIKVNDDTVNKYQLLSAVNNYLNQLTSFYAMFGQTPQVTLSEVTQTVVDALVQEIAVAQKAEELGMYEFTEEENTKIDEAVESTIQSERDNVKSNSFAETELEGDALETAIDEAYAAELATYGYTLDTYKELVRESQKDTVALEKLKAKTIEGVTVTDEEIQADYDAKVENAKVNYEGNLSNYGTAVNGTGTVYYNPAGYRYVKQILRSFSEETKTLLSDLNTKITAKNTEITDITTEIEAIDPESAEDEEAKAMLVTEKADKEAALATLQAELADLEKQLADETEKAYKALETTTDEIMAKLNPVAVEGEETPAPADFDALVEEYNEDPGMQSEPIKSRGYAVCEGFTLFDTAFVEAAIGIETIGGVSQPTRGQHGIYILQYVGDVEEGPVPLDDVREGIESALLKTNQDNHYNEQVAAWVEAAKVTINQKEIDAMVKDYQ